jgi:UDP-glucuronate decarboxylase
MMNTNGSVIGPLNLGNPSEYTTNQLALVIKKLTGTGSTFHFKDLPQDDPRPRKPDLSKASTLLGWNPSTDLADGLSKTILYFKDETDNEK